MSRRAVLAGVLFGVVGSACTSIDPRPPGAAGVHWERYTLAQSSPARRLKSPRVSITSAPNLQGPFVTEDRDFRYRLDVEIDDGKARRAVVCEQRGSRGEEYGCEDTHRPFSVTFASNCATGRMSSGEREYAISPWFHGDTLVGFIAQDGSRPIVAIDTDHEWTRPVWIARGLSPAELIDVDTLAYIVNDMFAAQSSGGYPFLCGELMSAQRYPRG